MGLLDGINPFGGNQTQPSYAPSYPEQAGMYAAMEAEDLKGIVGVTLDNSSLLISIESALSGKILVSKMDDKTGRKYTEWKQVGRPKMNEKGVQAVLMEVRTFLDKNVIMGFYPDMEELNNMWEAWAVEFGIFLGRNSEEFEIVGSYRSMIAMHVCVAVRQTMLRALNGNEKQGVYKMIRRIENASGDTVGNRPLFSQAPKI